MRYVHALCGLALLAAFSGCSKGTSPSDEQARASEPKSEPVSAIQYVSSRKIITETSSKQIVTGTFACWLGPIVRESGGAVDRTGSAARASTLGLGLTPERCAAVADAAKVSSDSLERGDASAILAVRRELESKLSTEGVSPQTSNDTLAFFDKGKGAAREARQAYGALFERTNGEDGFQASRHLAALYQFGRDLGTTDIGTEAQTLAWIIGVHRFMWTKNVPAEQRSAVAEPFFKAILNVSEPAPTAGHATATWSEYLAAAARAMAPSSTTRQGTPRAIGGGPTGADEDASFREVSRMSEERLEALGQKLPVSSDLRMQADLTAIRLRKLQ
jgi:hypothetical protein